ncbi:hypothetical protein EZJ55_00790 [Microcystis aeruginosa EAWAG127a]|jgi:hypothetical protein|uniref:Uncharacterized protein n=1 Tax=Microcystis aeruginosa EAWAG127a TaxID=2529855 RepID=A0A5J5M1E5_MICAE|nr:hypothetical protein [Microcystis aeruginosa]KAB0238260.1 hypothetical protein EZJ55_24645 [Microcystis aeruginosa EAWAG127a]KAB0243755.1 hypothetical protein EZJ55_00790 [Microcystis aeruginosa EAWAG127a]
MENTKELLSESKGELIQKLNERYGIGKSVIYKRLEFLEISIRQSEGISFLFSAEIQILDDLHEWMKQGKQMIHFSKPGKLAISESGSIESATPSIEYTTAEEGNQINQLIRVAQEQAAGLLMAQNILAAQYKDNPDLLPEDLRSKVRATEEAVAPKSIDPEKYALSLIAKVKAA